MRKIILTFLGLMLSSGVGMAVSSSDDIIKQLFADNGITTSLSTDSSELKSLSQEEDAFNNLYLFMYQNVKLAPKDETLKTLAADPDYSAYSTDDLAAIVEGDITKITAILGAGTEQSKVISAYTQINDAYTDELQLQTDNRGLLYEALAKEIFYNNDLSDSASVDILYDLDLINYLLFNEYITYGTPIKLASEELFGTPKLGKVKRSTDSGSDSGATTTETMPPSALAAISNIVCSIDTELSDAISAFEAANPESVTKTPTSDGASSPTPDGTTSGGLPPATSDGPAETYEKPTVDDFVETLSGGTLGNWDRSLPCDEVFCITVELIPGDAGISTASSSQDSSDESYEKTDDCIACHINYIAQRLTETLSKPLSPNKVPMNNYEDGTCKDAGAKINLDINVYTIKKPIFTPENDTALDAASKDVDDLKKLVWSSRGLTGTGDITGQKASDLDASRILSTRAGANQEEVVNEIIIANQAKMDAIQKLFDDFELKVRGQTSQNFEDQILIELATLKSYFQQFKDSLNSTIAPLEDLAGKKYCE